MFKLGSYMAHAHYRFHSPHSLTLEEQVSVPRLLLRLQVHVPSRFSKAVRSALSRVTPGGNTDMVKFPNVNVEVKMREPSMKGEG